MKIIEADYDSWQDIVDSSEYSTIYHRWDILKITEKYAYRKFLNKSFKYRFVPIIVFDKAPLLAFPIFICVAGIIKTVESPPSHSLMSYLGPIFPKNIKEKKVIKANISVNKYIKKELSPDYINIYTSPNIDDARPYRWCNYTTSLFSTYYIHIDSTNKFKEEYWKSLPKKLRSNIRRAERHVEIIENKYKYIDDLISLLRKRKKYRASSEYLYEVLKNTNNIFISAVKEGKFVSGIVFLIFKNKMVAWVGSPKPAVNVPSINELLIWKGIKWAIENGIEIFEIEGADEKSLFLLKSRFNGKLVPYISAKWRSKKWNFLRILLSLKNIKGGFKNEK